MSETDIEPRALVSPDGRRLQVLFEGHLIADSTGAVVLRQPGAAGVRYFPRKDVAMGFLAPSGRRERCGVKGEAEFFTLSRDGRILEDLAWSYAAPEPGYEAIAGMIAFAPQAVEIHDAGAAPAEPTSMAGLAQPSSAPEHDVGGDIARPYRDSGGL